MYTHILQSGADLDTFNGFFGGCCCCFYLTAPNFIYLCIFFRKEFKSLSRKGPLNNMIFERCGVEAVITSCLLVCGAECGRSAGEHARRGTLPSESDTC